MRWKLFAATGWACVGLALLAGARDGGEVRTKRLVIEDERGNEVIVIGPNKHTGEQQIRITHPEKDASIRLGIDNKFGLPGLSLDDHESQSGAFVGVTRNGARIHLSGGKPSRVRTIGVDREEQP